MIPAYAAPVAGAVLASVFACAAGAQTLDRYGGGALPPAPYAAEQQEPYPAPAYRAGTVRAYPGVSPYTVASRQPSGALQPAATTAGLRTLGWPGKAQAQPPSAMATRYRSPAPSDAVPSPTASGYAPTPMQGRLPPPPFSQPRAGFAAAPAMPAPTYAFAPPPAAAAPQPVAPTSIYSDPPAWGAPAPQAYAYGSVETAPTQPAAPAAFAAGPGGSRQYSLHRDYGLAPDPAPIPPQFFANTADLSAPETPDVATPPRVTGNATTAKASENAARLAASAAP